MVNHSVGVYNRTNLTLNGQPLDLRDFVISGGRFTFDPQIKWDEQSDRWYYTASVMDETNGNAWLAWGWSKTADPRQLAGDNNTSGWCKHLIPISNDQFDDAPKLGTSDQFVIIGTNVHMSAPPRPFVSARIWALGKPAAGDQSCSLSPRSGASPTFGEVTEANALRDQDGVKIFAPSAALSNTGTSVGFIASARNPDPANSPDQTTRPSLDRLVILGVSPNPNSNPPGRPQMFSPGLMHVTPYDLPPNATQSTSTNQLDTGQARLTQAVVDSDPDANGQLAIWTQHTVINGDGTRSIVRWYELLPFSLSERQEGAIDIPPLFTFNGAISPTNTGRSAVINFNDSGSGQLTEIRARSRIRSMPPGTLGRDVILDTSSGDDQDQTCTDNGGVCKWGDYAGASPDPISNVDVWGSSQTLDAPAGPDDRSARWRTRNFVLRR
jgi:hypothetical protein